MTIAVNRSFPEDYADLLHTPRWVRSRLLPRARGADAHDGKLAGREGRRRDPWSRATSFRNGQRDHLVKIALMTGLLPALMSRARPVRIDADNIVPVLRETGRRDRADVAEAKDRNVHGLMKSAIAPGYTPANGMSPR
jgi:hypothetical protein